MEIMKTDNIGFCFGVKRAIDVILKTAAIPTGKSIHWPVIPQSANSRYAQAEGGFPVTDIREITDGIVVLRTHGSRSRTRYTQKIRDSRSLTLPVLL
jgi:4-hydroxy-3-methylbut-2-enyl diphosphate reductase